VDKLSNRSLIFIGGGIAALGFALCQGFGAGLIVAGTVVFFVGFLSAMDEA
jgi:hypothetical protein